MNIRLRNRLVGLLRGAIATGLGLGLCASMIASAASLADQPVFSTSSVPGNLALTLSVEWPTASRTAHTDAYSSNSTYLGYFDPNKCYLYQVDTTANGVSTADKGDSSYFYPAGLANNRSCAGMTPRKWSGNFLNWAATSTIDPFRWAMTGGRRVVDTATTTILEKAWHGNRGLFPDRDLTVSEIPNATPYPTATRVGVSITNRGFKMRLSTVGGGSRSMLGQYFNSTDLSGGVIATVTNDNANHSWGGNSPTAGIGADNFSARFTGTFTAPESGTYTFRTTSDDGVRLWVDTTGSASYATCTGTTTPSGNCVVNNWTDHGSVDDDATVALTAGQTFTVKIEYYEKGGDATMRFQWRKPSATDFTAFSDDGGDTDYTMRVKVCDTSAAAGGLEGNCKAYGANAKPEGLIQQYADKMRYSAFGYLNDGSSTRDGAVLRARQKFVGPTYPVPASTPATNGANEWSAIDGTFVRNPDPTDAANTLTTAGVSVADSGVMNYLNKFGQLIPGDYKDLDPVNELYYAALRYYRNLGNVPAWSNTTNTNDVPTKTKWVDGFPVIDNWGDPMQYACQRNFVLGIGDIYTWNDKNVPGNTRTDAEPAMPAQVTADTTVNAMTATNRVGVLQGMGTTLADAATGAGGSSYYMAGLAYDANTKDIRSDLIGMQTVQTYWVDVLEQSFQNNNKFYLAAKYGGLNSKKLPATFDPYTFAGPIPLDWWSTNGETLTDTRGGGFAQPRPDNYFAAGRPDTMVAGLKQAFERISNEIDAYTTSFSLSTVQVQSSGAASYGAQYDAKDWTGILSASQIVFDADGNPTSVTPQWSSATKLEAQLAGTGWDTNRRVATWNGTAGAPFRYGNLTAAQQGNAAGLGRATLYGSGSTASNYVDYLRGDRSKEKTDTDNTKPYRKRALLLGDIVNAKVTPVGPPNRTLSEALNPGYAAFKTAYAARRTMVYVGANDGMLHAFDGTLTGVTAGTEQFAYVPSFLFAGPTLPTPTPETDGLVQLGNPAYQHRNYVDATPRVFDIDFKRTVASTSTGSSDWRSILIGGLGKGGKGFYAIDVTDPASMTGEAAVAGKVLWEFTDSTMGFSFGAPNVVKTRKYGWVVVLTSGYNNTGGAGNGYIYIVNPKTGTLLERISTSSASDGLAQASAYVQDFSDNTADAVYAGDLNGQMWRFDLTGTTGSYPAGIKLATATDASATPKAQPITTAPLIEIQPQSRKRFVMFGTGQLLDAVDIGSTSAQTFYGILDGSATAFAPASASMPITRASLTQISDVLTGTTLSTTSMGWYIDLGVDTTSGVAWRLVSNPTTFSGIVAFAPLLTTRDACSPSGSSRLYAIDYATGKSVLTSDGTVIGFVSYSNALTDIKFVGVDRTARLITGDIKGQIKKEPFQTPAGQGIRLLNWREVPTVD